VGAGVALAATGLRKSFDGGLVEALRGIDLEVAAGARLAIMGPTGCGKSTLLSLLALLEKPDGGEIVIDGRPAAAIGRPEEWRRHNLGMVFQFHYLLPHLTVAENVALPLLGGPLRDGRRAHVDDLLDDLGLAHRRDSLAARLSGGERQLVAVARGLVNGPRLVLADEPTGSVDTATGSRILDVLLDWCREHGATMLMVTHDAGIAGRLDAVMHMRDGRVAAGA
jgi:putative ABC transport system ATP-binding protein